VLQRAFPDDAEAAASYLADVADRCAGVTDVETMVVERDSIPDAILEGVALDTLVCMSSQGRGGIARAVMGSVAEALLRTIDLPVLVVGPHVADSFTFSGRVAACVDGSHESERTLAPAQAWAAALALPLWLIEVAVPSTPVEWTTQVDVVDSADLARLARRLGDVAGWETYHSRHPARELAAVTASEYEPTALLVMATHGRTGWDRLRLGSVTATAIHAATVPVLVVPVAPAELAGQPAVAYERAPQP
jgi:nucleotide-binding universal stress UspA family protein